MLQISNGAELVVLSKAFIMQHLTDSLKSKLRRQVINYCVYNLQFNSGFVQVVEYPSEEAMRKRIRDHYTWSNFKQVSLSKRKL